VSSRASYEKGDRKMSAFFADHARLAGGWRRDVLLE